MTSLAYLDFKVRYSYGVNLLSRADTTMVLPSISDADEDVATEPTPISISKQHDRFGLSESPDFSEVGNVSQLASHSRSTSHTNQTTIFAEPNSSGLHPPKHTPAFYTFPNTPNDSNLTLARPDSRQIDYSGDSDVDSETTSLLRHTLPGPFTEGEPLQPSPVIQILRHTKHRIIKIWIAIRTFMTAPLWAALLSLIVAVTDPLKHALEN